MINIETNKNNKRVALNFITIINPKATVLCKRMEMDESLLKKLVKTRSILKRKFRSLKIDENENEEKLKKKFKPITEPLKEIIKCNKRHNDRHKEEEKSNNKIESSFAFKKFFPEVGTSTPKRELHYHGDDDDDDDVEEDDDDNNGASISENEDSTFNSAIDLRDVTDLSILQKMKLLDTTYGPHKNINNVWKFGNSEIKITKEKIIIGNQNWALTPGLAELLFFKEPKNYEPYELDIYKKILINTSAHKRKYNSSDQIKGTKSKKYKSIIKELFKNDSSLPPIRTLRSQTQKKGSGMLMKLNNYKHNYIYWNDPNELVDRLRLLLASEGAGHNNHRNEINSIIEELQEANIIV